MKHDRHIQESAAHPVVKRLTEVRLAWGLSVDDMAERIGCRKSSFYHMESGHAAPSFKTLVRWADVLGYDISIWPKESAK